MARYWQDYWGRRFLVVFIAIQSLTTLFPFYRDSINTEGNSPLSWYACAAPENTNTNTNTDNPQQRYSIHPHYHYTPDSDTLHINNDVFRAKMPFRRREIVQDIMDDDDDDSDDNGDDSDDDTRSRDSFSAKGGNSPRVSRATTTTSTTTVHQLKLASVLCNSDTPQLLGPDWNGTFSTNSPDGAYPSLNRTCTFTIHAMPSSGGNGGNSRPTPYVVALTFSTPIQLVCGIDYLTLFDGPDTTAPILAKICGNIWLDRIPTFYSTGSVLTAVFSTQESSPGSFGFTAVWRSIETAGFKDFTPRSQHAMAYDSVKDIVYISGGTSLRNPYLGDLLTYNFASNKWNKITSSSGSPDPRYGHYAFMHDGNLYIYGGVTIIGALADLWKFDGKTWTRQQAINPEKLPAGRIGAACVVVTNNNSTLLYVFGGLTTSGVTTRELSVYDLATNKWTRQDHQNSVGLSGATAVYHRATNSIYYFGGMVNQTERNVITYQYRIYQDLWYALGPRIDPLTATPVSYWNVTNNPVLNSTTSESIKADGDDDDDDDDGDFDMPQNSTVNTLPAVMYDPLTAIWTPAGVIDDDTVVMFGGMRPYGPGVNEREQSCYASSVAVYDLSCQNWTSYDVSGLDSLLKGRVNHTMVIRPPGSPGGSKTAYTAYIFGGFDGMDRADMLNATMIISALTPASINSCRALRWCNLYDDCPYCPTGYCSYIDGLCLFDTDKAKNSQSLVGNSNDIPRFGTYQDLLRQRPDLKQKAQGSEICPSRIALELKTPSSGTIQSGQEITFSIYVDAPDLNIQFEIRTLPTSALEFKTLNVWEGFMNMYWRADHVLTDGSWAPAIDLSALDLPIASNSSSDSPLISSGGALNTSELMSRWTKYSGLDSNLSTSALRDDTSYIYFLASDPRRFTGYHVFSLTNHNSMLLSYSVTVTQMDHPTTVDKAPGARFNMATLGYFMLGFIFAVVLLVFMARKIRQLVEDRDASHRAAEMQLLVDEDDDRQRRRENNHGGLHGGMTMIQMDGSMLMKKPLYRIVVGVQDMGKEAIGISGSNLRYRHGTRAAKDQRLDSINKTSSSTEGTSVLSRSISHPNVVESPTNDEQNPISPQRERRSRVRSDFIRDIGSAPLPLPVPEEPMIAKDENSQARSSPLFLNNPRIMAASTPDLGITAEPPVSNDNNSPEIVQNSSASSSPISPLSPSSLWAKSTPSLLIRQRNQRNRDVIIPQRLATSTLSEPSPSSLQRGWSLRSVGRNSSLSQSLTQRSKSGAATAEEREGLTSQISIEEEENPSGCGDSFDSERELVDLDKLASPTDLFRRRQEQIEKHYRVEGEEGGNGWMQQLRQRQRRNPIKVQPISIEPLPFHSGLVPRTVAHFKRYRRNLARQQRRQQKQQQQQQKQLRQHGQGQNQISMLILDSDESLVSKHRPPVLPQSSRSTLSYFNEERQQIQQQINQVRASRSNGFLREVCRVASRMASRSQCDNISRSMDTNDGNSDSHGGSLQSKVLTSKGSTPHPEWNGSNNGSQHDEDLEAAIEMRQLAVPPDAGESPGVGVGVGNRNKREHHDMETSIGASIAADSTDRLDKMPIGQDRPLGSPYSSPVQGRCQSKQERQNRAQHGYQNMEDSGSGTITGDKSHGIQKQKKSNKMRGRQEYEPGPLLAMNFLIVFPGDSGSRKVTQLNEDIIKDYEDDIPEKMNIEGEEGGSSSSSSSGGGGGGDTLYNNNEKRLPPMAIGTVFVPDPVRWWAYKAKQQLDRQKFERELRKLRDKQNKLAEQKGKLLLQEQQQQQQQQQILQQLQQTGPRKIRCFRRF
ncbi:Multiple epidermal growth factor-like domains protein 8 [Linnemannia zychae]|nr:Multiple epidermal growth factor-like domains protein 8 [Linnemannia zychae]